MDLSLSPDQELIKNTAREFVSQEFSKETILELDLTESGFNKDLWDSVLSLIHISEPTRPERIA